MGTSIHKKNHEIEKVKNKFEFPYKNTQKQSLDFYVSD